jgi:hypothetical protein
MSVDSENVKELIRLAAEHGYKSINEYTSWCFVSSLAGVTIGVVLLMVVGWILWRAFRIDKDDDFGYEGWDDGVQMLAIIAVIVCGVSGLAVIGNCIAGVFEPKAAAIHQLLMDLKR